MIDKFLHTLLLMGLILLGSCEKAPLNDAIEQHWKLEEFTTLTDDKTVKCDRLFMGITRNITTLSEKQGANHYGYFVARTSYRQNKEILVLSDFKVRAGTSDSAQDATVDQLKPFGINNPIETEFKVLELTHKKMILESDYARLKLKKF